MNKPNYPYYSKKSNLIKINLNDEITLKIKI